MSRLLHLAASPRGPASESLALAQELLDDLTTRRPDLTVETWDLWDGTLPDFGSDAATAKMALFAGEDPTGRAAEAWARVRATFERFDEADTYLLSVPMWNSGVPYILKQFIDIVSQPGMVFDFDPVEGYSGLLTGKKAIVIYTSAVYGVGRSPSFGADHQTSFLEDWLRWAGIEDITSIEFRPNLATDRADELRDRARQQLQDAAMKIWFSVDSYRRLR